MILVVHLLISHGFFFSPPGITAVVTFKSSEIRSFCSLDGSGCVPRPWDVLIPVAQQCFCFPNQFFRGQDVS